MTRMDRILRVDVEDLDVTVEAGVTRKQLDTRLRPEGVFFPVDPGADATIGGMVATGASGTTTVRYGAMRENVLSLTVVTRGRPRRADPLASAQVVRRLRPHAPLRWLGGDARRDHGGDARIYPTPEAISSAVCSFPSLDAAVSCVIRAIQLGHPGRAHRAARRGPDRRGQSPLRLDYPVAPTLFLEFHGSAAGVAEQAEEVAGIAEELGAGGLRLGDERGGAAAPLGGAARRLRGRARAAPGLPRLRHRRVRPHLRLAELRHRDAGGHRRGRAPRADRRPRRRRELPRRASSSIPDDAGEIARVETSPSAWPTRDRARRNVHRRARRRLRQGQVPPARARRGGVDLMRRIKVALDPDGIMNPGKILL